MKTRSVRTGEFTLSSGKTSQLYIDARRTTMTAEGSSLVGSLGLEAIRTRRWAPACVGGLTLGADPVAYAISAATNDAPPIINAFTVRKTDKAHGIGRRIEGCLEQGDVAVVVEDVITTGRSAIDAVDAVRAEGGKVLGVLAVVDRGEGGADVIHDAGLDLVVLLHLSDLGLSPQ